MARKKTLSMLSNKLEEKVNEVQIEQDIKQELQEVSSTVEPQRQPTQQQAQVAKMETQEKTPVKKIAKPSIFQKKIEKAGNVNKTFRVNEEIITILEDLIRDPETKKIAPNMFGVMSKIINNGLIKEMIELGILDESYKSYIEEY